MANTIKIQGVKKAVGDFNHANAGGYYSPRYGLLMLDRSTGEIWTDEYYSLGHFDFKKYHSAAIVNLIYYMCATTGEEFVVNMANVREAAERICAEYQNQLKGVAL